MRKVGKKFSTRKKILFVVLIASFFLVFPLLQSFFLLPFQLRLQQGELQSFSFQLPLGITIHGDKAGIIKLNGDFLQKKALFLAPKSSWQINPLQIGEVNLEVKLLGIIPCKKVRIEVVSPTKVIPVGSSIGVLFHTDGVIVVGFSSIIDSYGRLHYPGREVGIALGDLISKVNGKKISSINDIIKQIARTGKEDGYLTLEVQRKNNTFVKRLKPIFCRETGKYRIGLYVLDSTEGVGTLTFYNPQNKKYGALGHLVTEGKTNSKMVIGEGKIVDVSICSLEKGKRGKPGEKIGAFTVGKDKVLGNIEKNTNLGIFGTLEEIPASCYYHQQAFPVALVEQVKEGPAEMLTVLKDRKVEKFQVIVEKVIKQKKPNDKGLVIKVVDKKLLKETGGIIQGMSGSPLIQDGKLIGAVTHVFINNPVKGYGVLAEWMLKETS